MKYHSKSLFLSIIIHLFLLGVFVFVYSVTLKTFSTTKEERVCVRLNCIKKEAKQKQTTQKRKKVEKKVQKRKASKDQSKKKPITHPKKIEHKKFVKTVPKKRVAEVETMPKAVSKKPLKPVKQKKSSPTKSEMKKCKITKQKSNEEIYVKNNLDKIAALIHENLYYPRRARKRGIEGVVVVSFHLTKEGDVTAAKIISAKQSILGRAALRTINELSGEFPKPSEELTLTVPIHYKLD